MILPPGTRSLLGLGLKFCIERPRPYQDIDQALIQFKRSIDLRCHLERNNINTPDPSFNPRLYMKHPSWDPDPCDKEFEEAFLKFENELTIYRRNLPSFRRFNLRPIQRRAMSTLLQMGVIIHGADKGLGPYVASRPKAIKQVITEHLSGDTYEQLSEETAKKEQRESENAFRLLVKKHEKKLDHITWFERSFLLHAKEGSRTPVFYPLWKVHKNHPSVRPVISSCGSFPEIFSIYADEKMKRLVQDVLKTYIISSDQLVYALEEFYPNKLPAGALLFSVDAVGMYGNIDTDHGIEVTEKFLDLYGNRISDKIPKEFIISILKLIMKRNIFSFGDTFWKQTSGTAMGTSCAVNYAFLYMGLLEMLRLLNDFKQWMPWYGRFIDDGLGIWLSHRSGSAQAWERFMSCLNNWGKLKWTTTGLVRSLVFLDLTVTINEYNKLEFQSYRKPMSLQSYLPPNSAHPPDTLRSIICGRVRAYFLHCTHHQDFETECTELAKNLIASGWEWKAIRTHFNDIEQSLLQQGKKKLLQIAKKTRRQKDIESPPDHIIVFKLPYHPRGIQRRQCATAYNNSGLAALMPERRFITAQLRPKNLRDRVCRTTLRNVPGANPSDFLSTNHNTPK